jgi:large subunit ribosomal protein L19
MLRKAIADIEAKYVRKDIPDMRSGDMVRVHTKIKEGDKERIQVYEGVVIAYRKGTPGRSMFTVRKVSYGVGVERMFPVHSPRIDKIEVLGHGEVRRSRLYYLRALQGKAARLHQASTAETAAVPAAAAPTPPPAPASAPQA